MTRPDYIDELDAWHIINVDKHHFVRPDSRLMLTVFREVAAEEDFQDQVGLFPLSVSTKQSYLLSHTLSQIDNVMSRVNFIESLHRTR